MTQSNFDTSLMYPSAYLKADDLDKDYTLTMTRVEHSELTMVGNIKKWSYLLYFDETAKSAKKSNTEEKSLVLNKTNTMIIKGMYGKLTKEWIGKKVTLYATTTKLRGKVVPCIRIREGLK